MVPRVSRLERGKFRERENIRNVQHPAEHESRIRIHFGRNATRGNVAYFIGHGLRISPSFEAFFLVLVLRGRKGLARYLKRVIYAIYTRRCPRVLIPASEQVERTSTRVRLLYIAVSNAPALRASAFKVASAKGYGESRATRQDGRG